MASNFGPGTETTPLLYPTPNAPYPNEHPYRNVQDHPFIPNRQHSKLKQFLKFLLILIPIIVLLLYIHKPKRTDNVIPPPEGVKNPKEHRLVWKGAQSFDYYLESPYPMIFSNGIDELGSNIGNKLVSDGNNENPKSAPRIEFVAKTNSTLSARKEKVTKEKLDELRKGIAEGDPDGVEIFYDIFINFYESFKVLSATSNVDGEWTSSNITLISYDSEDKMNGNGKYFKESKVNEICEFKINWSDDLEGVILKRNVNFSDETSLNETGVSPYDVVAYVKGSIDYGFMFYENEDGSGKLFAETNQTEAGWKLDQRNIYMSEDSPIPAVLPALYIMYYDFFQRMSL